MHYSAPRAHAHVRSPAPLCQSDASVGLIFPELPICPGQERTGKGCRATGEIDNQGGGIRALYVASSG